MSDDLEDLPTEDEGPDELLGRATSSPASVPMDPEMIAELPVARLGLPGRSAVPPAGPRALRRPATTAGDEPRSRHNWVPIGPRNVAGRMRAIVCADPASADPQRWFAGSAGGGLWRTTNGGRRWELIPAWRDLRSLAVGALAIAPSDGQRLYAATGEATPASSNAVRGFGVFVSSDGGASWDNRGGGSANPPAEAGFDAVAVAPADRDHCWAVGPDGAFRTLDGGASWHLFAAGTHFTDVAFAGARLWLVRGRSTGGEGAVIRLDAPGDAVASVDAALVAATSRSTVVPPRAARAAWPVGGKIAIASATMAYLRLVDEDDRHIGLFRSQNIGAATGSAVTWTRLAEHPDFASDGQGTYGLCLAVDPTAPGRVVTGMVLLHAATNADGPANAVSWRRVMSWPLHGKGLRGHHADQHHLAIAGTPAQVWVANDGGIARSVDAFTANQDAPFDRPVDPGVARWERRDLGIQGAQPYDLAQNPLIGTVLASGLQDHGTYLRSGGQTWRPIFGADGASCAFDPDDPYRLDISYYRGLLALQFPALLDTHFPDQARDLAETGQRHLQDGLSDDAPFTPETARDPRDTGRVLHARRGRLYGLRTASGERFAEEPVGRSFVLWMRLPRPASGPTTRLPRPLRRPAPFPPEPRMRLEVANTPGAHKVGLVPGRGLRVEYVDVADYQRVVVASRLPGPYRLAEGDQVRVNVDGTDYTATFRAADGIRLDAVSVADVVRTLRAVLPAAKAEVHPSFWRRPAAVQLVTRSTGSSTSIRVDGDALDPLPDGLSRLGVNRGTYPGDTARPASLLFAHEGFERGGTRPGRDFSGTVRTLRVSVDGGPLRDVKIQPPAFPDPANVTAGQLTAALSAALAGDAVDVHAVPHFAAAALLSDARRRVVLSDTAADRIAAPRAGAPLIRLGIPSRTAGHGGLHRRNFASLDLTPAVPGTPLKLVISDGTTTTPPLEFTAAKVADLRAVTAEELHRLVSAHLAATPGIQVRADLVVAPSEGWVSELVFTPTQAWAGTQDGCVFVTSDSGAAWTDVSSAAMHLADREVDAIAVHPRDLATAWVGLSGESTTANDPGFLFRTRDGGRTWQQIGHKVVGGVAQGIVSGGLPLGITAVELDPDDPQVLFAATDAGVFRSVDSGDTWGPFSEGLPNEQVVDLVSHAELRVLRACLWTGGVFERRIDAEPPDDVRLLIRATESDDGRRPARAAPALGTATTSPLALGSPDITILATRPARLGTDADVDGVTYDLDVPQDELVAGASALVMVQVTNMGPTPVPVPAPPPGPPPEERARVVVLLAGVDDGIPPLPPDFFSRLAAGTLAGAAGAWTVVGDDRVPRTVAGGDTGIVTLPVTWPALDGVTAVGLLAVTTAAADPLDRRDTDVAALLATERRVAYREIPVRSQDDDRTLLVRSTDGRQIIIEAPAAGEGSDATGVLGFGGVLGPPGAPTRRAATAPGDERDLSGAGAGPAIVVRSAAPLVADLVLDPGADEAANVAAVRQQEVVRILQRRARAANLPLQIFGAPAGFVLTTTGGAQLRASGPAAAPLGLPVAAVAAPELSTSSTGGFSLAGTPSLTLTVVLAGGNVTVPVDLSAARFGGHTVVRAEEVARAVLDDLRLADVDGLVTLRMPVRLVMLTNGTAPATLGGPAVPLLRLGAGPSSHFAAVPAPDTVDLTGAPVLHVNVTPRALVRFDADPAEIPDLARARLSDVRRAISLACELTGVPARADLPSTMLRVAASPEDSGRRHPVLGGAHLAELAASETAVLEADRPALFAVRTALGRDVLKAGATNNLYLRVRNGGTVAATARLRLVRLQPWPSPNAPAPVTTALVASASPAIAAGSAHVEEFTWDAPGPAPRQELLLVVADEDRDGHRVLVPGIDPGVGASFPSLEEVRSFASKRPGVALRLFDVTS